LKQALYTSRRNVIFIVATTVTVMSVMQQSTLHRPR